MLLIGVHDICSARIDAQRPTIPATQIDMKVEVRKSLMNRLHVATVSALLICSQCLSANADQPQRREIGPSNRGQTAAHAGYGGQPNYHAQGGYGGQANFHAQAGYGGQSGYHAAGYGGQSGYHAASYGGQTSYHAGGYGGQSGYHGGYGSQTGYHAGYGGQTRQVGYGGQTSYHVSYGGQTGYHAGYGGRTGYQAGYGGQSYGRHVSWSDRFSHRRSALDYGFAPHNGLLLPIIATTAVVALTALAISQDEGPVVLKQPALVEQPRVVEQQVLVPQPDVIEEPIVVVPQPVDAQPTDALPAMVSTVDPPADPSQQAVTYPPGNAPADEYFGQSKMSVLGLRNTVNDVDLRATDSSEDSARDLCHKLIIAEAAFRDWQAKYPGDTWVPQYGYAMVQDYLKLDAVLSNDDPHVASIHGIDLGQWLDATYPNSQYAPK